MDRNTEFFRYLSKNKWIVICAAVYSILLIASIICYTIQARETMECGVTVGDPFSLILNGTEAPLGYVPWYIAIKNRDVKRTICGGTIISSQWIITAKHCAFKCGKDSLDLSCMIVVAGSQHILDHSFGTVHRILEVKTYDDPLKETIHDIALMKVSPRFKVRDTNLYGNRRAISPACLAEPGEEVTEKEAVASGFGISSEFHIIQPEHLMTVKLNIMNVGYCNYLKDKDNSTINGKTDLFLCAGVVEQRKGVCKGDSGGPLTVLRNNVVTLIGVTHTIPYTGCEKFGFYMNVAFYRKWIKSSTGI